MHWINAALSDIVMEERLPAMPVSQTGVLQGNFAQPSNEADGTLHHIVVTALYFAV